MKIIELRSENVKRIEAVDITPDLTNPLVVIGGNNDQGKSSVLDSIIYPLQGARSLPPQPIRKGQKRATSHINLGDIVIDWVMTERGGARIEVKNGDGAIYKTPQALLDGLKGKIGCFDLQEFIMMEGAKRKATLKELVGIDFTEVDTERKRLFDERTQVNREVKALKNQVEALTVHRDVPNEEVSVAALIEEQQEKLKINHENQKKREALKVLAGRRDQLRAEIERVKVKLNELEEAYSEVLLMGKTSATEIANLADEDLESVKTQIQNAEATNIKVRENLKRAGLLKGLDTKEVESESLTAAIDKIDSDKTAALTSANFPIAGLGFSDELNDITFDNIPWTQLGTAARYEISASMGFAINPKLRVLLVRDGSAIDEDHTKRLAEIAAAHDGQVWMEVVSTDPSRCSVIIEDGKVKKHTPSLA